MKPYYTEIERVILLQAIYVNNVAKNRFMFGDKYLEIFGD